MSQPEDAGASSALGVWIMSLFRTVFVVAAAVMLLPAEEKKQTEFASTATRAAEHTATFCERNPSTCTAGREMWSLFLKKAEYGLELGARLLRDQLARAAAGDAAPGPTAAEPAVVPARSPAAHHQVEPLYLAPPARNEATTQRRSAQQQETGARWR
jgi:hypothetical protein